MKCWVSLHIVMTAFVLLPASHPKGAYPTKNENGALIDL